MLIFRWHAHCSRRQVTVPMAAIPEVDRAAHKQMYVHVHVISPVPGTRTVATWWSPSGFQRDRFRYRATVRLHPSLISPALDVCHTVVATLRDEPIC